MPIVLGSGPASCPQGAFVPAPVAACACTEILQLGPALSDGINTVTIQLNGNPNLDVSTAIAKTGVGAVIPTTSVSYNQGIGVITVVFVGAPPLFFNLTGLLVVGDCCPFTLPQAPIPL